MKLVTAAIVIEKNTILLARRKPGEHLEGFWEFPGGKIEDGESPQSCLERELLEEFSVQSKAGDIVTESVYEYENGSIKLIGIRTELMNKKITLSVHDKVKWVSVESLLQYKLAPADIPIAKYIMEISKNV